MNDTAWSNNDICDHILNTNFPPLNKSNHFHALNKCVERIKPDINSVLDLGCCKAEFSDTFPDIDYCGADLSHIIENVSKKVRPDNKYINLNADMDSLSILYDFDLIVMNSFLSEMKNPLKTLHSVLTYSKKYVIIHRQDIVNHPTRLETYKTYGGLETVNSLINTEDFNHITKSNRFHVVMVLDPYEDSQTKKTILLSK